MTADPIRTFHLFDCPYRVGRGDCICGPVPRRFVRLDGSSVEYTADADVPSLIAAELALLDEGRATDEQ